VHREAVQPSVRISSWSSSKGRAVS
jgi:hypothetical protein